MAVSEEKTVDPRQPTRRERVPQELPAGVSVEGLGLRGTVAGVPPMGAPMVSAAPIVMKSMAARDEKERSVTSASWAPPPAPPSPSPPPSRQAPRPTAETFTGVIGRVFGGRFEADDEAREEGEAVAHEAAAPVTTLRGRVTRRSGREVVVEIEVTGALAWDPPADADVELDDGRFVDAEVDLGRSAGASSLAGGLVIRLVFRLPDGAGAAGVRGVTLRAPGGELRIELEAR